MSGPLVRISPNEVHCSDPDMVDEIYAGGGRRREKSAHWCSSLAGPVADSILTTRDHDVHRRRRQALSNSFSKAAIVNLEPMIHEKVQTLCDKLLRYPPRPFDITAAYSCFTTDVITDYCFGEPFGLLKQVRCRSQSKIQRLVTGQSCSQDHNRTIGSPTSGPRPTPCKTSSQSSSSSPSRTGSPA